MSKRSSPASKNLPSTTASRYVKPVQQVNCWIIISMILFLINHNSLVAAWLVFPPKISSIDKQLDLIKGMEQTISDFFKESLNETKGKSYHFKRQMDQLNDTVFPHFPENSDAVVIIGNIENLKFARNCTRFMNEATSLDSSVYCVEMNSNEDNDITSRIDQLNGTIRALRDDFEVFQHQLNETTRDHFKEVQRKFDQLNETIRDHFVEVQRKFDQLNETIRDHFEEAQPNNETFPNITGIPECDKAAVAVARDCTQLRDSACFNTSGIYTIYPTKNASVEVYCDMVTAGGGWTVFQRRHDGSVDFYRYWTDYKVGFGNKSSEFWLGNDIIHEITLEGRYELLVELEDWSGDRRYAYYQDFSIEDESDQYRLHLGPYGTGYVFEFEVRLADGNSDYEGRVEAFVNGEWGTICDDSWGMDDANVVCRQIGLGSATAYFGSSHFGAGSGQILLDDVSCTGTESHLIKCGHSGLGASNCDHNEDAGVRCSGPTTLDSDVQTEGGSSDYKVRLADGTSEAEGRVEVFVNNQWGTVCDDNWDINDAHIVCNQLGYLMALEALGTAAFGEGSGSVWLTDVDCMGNETSLTQCTHVDGGTNSCGHGQDAGVICAKGAGDSMIASSCSSCNNNNQQFSTRDRDNDRDSRFCAVIRPGAWWFKACGAAFLNGRYVQGGTTERKQGIIWKEFKGYYYSLKFTEMKLRLVS